MNRTLVLAAALTLGAGAALAQQPSDAVAKAPPAEPYKAVSELAELPDFIPGIGQLFVDPSTLPAGPFLAYDRDGGLVSTVYMIPIDELNPDNAFEDLASPGGGVDHVDIHFNPGHPGVEVPHAHVVLWHVPADAESRVAE